MARSAGKPRQTADAEVRIGAAQIGLAHLDFVIAVLELHRALVLQLDILVIERELGEIGVHGNRIRLREARRRCQSGPRSGYGRSCPPRCKALTIKGSRSICETVTSPVERISAVQIHTHVAVQLSRGDCRIHL